MRPGVCDGWTGATAAVLLMVWLFGVFVGLAVLPLPPTRTVLAYCGPIAVADLVRCPPSTTRFVMARWRDGNTAKARFTGQAWMVDTPFGRRRITSPAMTWSEMP